MFVVVVVVALADKKNTASGISSIAALSLGFSMSISGASQMLTPSDDSSDVSSATRLRNMMLTSSYDEACAQQRPSNSFLTNLRRKSTVFANLSE